MHVCVCVCVCACVRVCEVKVEGDVSTSSHCGFFKSACSFSLQKRKRYIDRILCRHLWSSEDVS